MRQPIAFRPAAIAAAVTLLLAGCGGGGGPAGPVPTTVLPTDGGDLGRAWTELRDAMAKADKAKAGALLNDSWDLSNKQASWFGMFKDVGNGTLAGGKRQGDRATLFIASDRTDTHADYRHVSATWNGKNWRFDGPYVLGSSFDSTDAVDCAKHPTLFPCGAKSAPEAIVSGSVIDAKGDPLTRKAAGPVPLIDGVAARLFGNEDQTPAGTRIVLTSAGINPAGLAWSHDPGHVADWIGQPTLTLTIAPDGKSAKLKLKNGINNPEAAVTDGLTLETNDAQRVKGRLNADVKDVGKINVYFDIPAASRCHDGYLCGAFATIENPSP